jgi:hypothetical protein
VHLHAVVTAFSVSSAGMLLTFGLDELGREPVSALATRALIALYGGGQFVASIGMFVAGGYGAARKTPTGVGSLDAVAAAGTAVHGIAHRPISPRRRRGLCHCRDLAARPLRHSSGVLRSRPTTMSANALAAALALLSPRIVAMAVLRGCHRRDLRADRASRHGAGEAQSLP